MNFLIPKTDFELGLIGSLIKFWVDDSYYHCISWEKNQHNEILNSAQTPNTSPWTILFRSLAWRLL